MSKSPSVVTPDLTVQFAVEQAHDAILRIASTGEIVYANPAAHRMLGYEVPELTALEIYDIAPFYSPPQWSKRWQHLREVGGRLFEGTYRTKCGNHIPVEIAASHQVHGGKQFAEVIARDISDKKALERQLLEIQDREQTRIGQDLHDDIGQRLTGISLFLGALELDLVRGKSPDVGRVREIANYTRETLARIRALARGLSPILDDSPGLTHALENLATTVNDTLAVDCVFRCRCSGVIRDNFLANNAYRIVQEAIANAVRHGGATHIEIVCEVDGGQLTLKVIDDGSGIDGSKVSGFGISIMKHRARTMGGHLEVAAGDQKGVVVRLTCPVGSGDQTTELS